MVLSRAVLQYVNECIDRPGCFVKYDKIIAYDENMQYNQCYTMIKQSDIISFTENRCTAIMTPLFLCTLKIFMSLSHTETYDAVTLPYMASG